MKYIIVTLLVFFYTTLYAQRPLSQLELGWLERNTVSFNSKISDLSINYFNSISIPKDTRIVGLGEANHGTKEFQILKDKLAKYLIQNYEFNIIAFEFPYSDGLLLNKYVLGLEETGLEILIGRKNSEYHNKEFIEFIEDIRKLNATRKLSERIQFMGSDIFGKPSAVKQLMEYIQKHDIAFLDDIKEYEALSVNLYLSAFQQDEKEFKQLSKIILNQLKDNANQYLLNSTDLEYNRMLRLAELLAVEWKGKQRSKEWSNNVLQILNESPDNKIFFFGHNIHVGSFYKKEVGSFIKKKYDKYFTIGTDYSSGSFMAKNLEDRKNPRPDTLHVVPMKNSFADHISKQDGNIHFLNLPSKDSDSTKWLFKPNYIARVGFGFLEPFTKPEEGREKYILPKSLDAIIVFNQISPTILLNE